MLSNLNSLARGLALVLAVAALAGCATSKEKLLTHGDRTMMDIWPLSLSMSEATPAPAAVIRACEPRYCWALLRRSPLTQGMP